MNRPNLRRAGVAGTLLLVALDLHAQVARPPVTSSSQANAAAITGTVVDALTDRPIAGALVTVVDRRPGTAARPFVQITTPRGRFAFANLPASEFYVLMSAKPGYLDGGYGRPDPRGPGAPIVLAEGQWLSDVRVRMTRPGSISGTIADERGEPVVGVYVRTFSQVLVAGRTEWLPGPVSKTDDRGSYRIAPLAPGKYLVSVPALQATLPATAGLASAGANAGTSMTDLREAREAAAAEKLLFDLDGTRQLVVGRYAPPPPPGPDGEPRAYPAIFHPSATSPAEARVVEIGTSQNQGGIDIQLQPVRTGRVSGVVQGPGARGNLLLRLIPRGLEDLGQGSEAATTVTEADGRFTFFGVPYGSYLLESRHIMVELTHTSADSVPTAVPAPIPFPTRNAAAGSIAAASYGVEYAVLRDEGVTEPGVRTLDQLTGTSAADRESWGQLRIDVDAPITDRVVLPLHRAVTISGRVVVPPGAPQAGPILEPASGRRTLGLFIGGPNRGFPDFSISGVLGGEYYLRVRSTPVESIRWKGEDYTDRPFDTTSGDDISGVVITLAAQKTTISGLVTMASGPVSAGAAVIAFPIERERWSNYGFNPTRLKSVLTTIDGRYRVEGLPPGDYYLAAVRSEEERAWLDSAFLASIAGAATRLRLDAGSEVKDFTLRLNR